jgi:hypothetical protein
MLRGVLGIVVGLVAGVLTTFVAQLAGHMIYPPPPGIDLNDPALLQAFMKQVPMGAKVGVLVAWALGIFVGSAVAISVAQRRSWPAWATAVLLFGAALYTMVLIPHPDWMLWGATALTLASAISAAYIWARS